MTATATAFSLIGTHWQMDDEVTLDVQTMNYVSKKLTEEIEKYEPGSPESVALEKFLWLLSDS